jgi:tRNA-dihydrouridine synthase 1
VVPPASQALRIPVLGNGNIRTLRDCHTLMAETGVDGVMSAESLLRDPALFSQVG